MELDLNLTTNAQQSISFPIKEFNVDVVILIVLYFELYLDEITITGHSM